MASIRESRRPRFDPRRLLSRRWLLGFILFAHTLLGVLYSVQIPMWESYDEWGHYAFARFLLVERRLPRAGERVTKRNDEGDQPPLYYWLAGSASAWVQAPLDFLPERNALFGEDARAGVNVAVHGPDERFPYQGVSLALHVMRGVSVLLSAVGIWATYQTVRVWRPDDEALALGAAGLHAVWPQFLFNGSVVTNDVLASVSASLLALALFRWWAQPLNRIAILSLGLTIALVLVSKYTIYGLALVVVPVVLARSFGAWRQATRPLPRQRWPWVLAAVSLVGLATGAGAYWLAHHAGQLAIVARLGSFLKPLDSSGYPGLAWASWDEALLYGLTTFWASFGWGNLEAPGWTYAAAALLALFALAGLLWRIVQPGGRTLVLGTAILFATIAGAISVPYVSVLIRRTPYLFHGRYFLSALTPSALLLALGFGAWWRRRWRGRALAALVVGLGGLSACLPFTVIVPAYRPPALLPAESEASIPHKLYNRFGGKILLVGYAVDDLGSRPGGQVSLDLYWKSLKKVPADYVVVVKAIDSEGNALGLLRTYPGGGNFATSLWEPGDFFRDRYVLPIPTDARAPAVGLFEVSLQRPHGRQAFRGPASSSTLLGEFKIAGQPPADPPQVPADYRLGSAVSFQGYSLTVAPNRAIELALDWQAEASRAGDWTVAVALLDDRQGIRAQADSPPLEGRYPTRLWDAGERVRDIHRLALPPDLPCGDYHLVFAMYDSASLLRLPISGEGSLTVRDNLFWVPLHVGPPDWSCTLTN